MTADIKKSEWCHLRAMAIPCCLQSWPARRCEWATGATCQASLERHSELRCGCGHCWPSTAAAVPGSCQCLPGPSRCCSCPSWLHRAARWASGQGLSCYPPAHCPWRARPYYRLRTHPLFPREMLAVPGCSKSPSLKLCHNPLSDIQVFHIYLLKAVGCSMTHFTLIEIDMIQDTWCKREDPGQTD